MACMLFMPLRRRPVRELQLRQSASWCPLDRRTDEEYGVAHAGIFCRQTIRRGLVAGGKPCGGVQGQISLSDLSPIFSSSSLHISTSTGVKLNASEPAVENYIGPIS